MELKFIVLIQSLSEGKTVSYSGTVKRTNRLMRALEAAVNSTRKKFLSVIDQM